MFETIKSNLEMAIRLKDKALFDIAKEALTEEVQTTLDSEQVFTILRLMTEFQFMDSDFLPPIPNLPVKECLLDDPTCENCSS